MSPRQPLLYSMRWIRFASYHVVAGTHIAPTARAQIDHYDPFEEYERTKSGRSGHTPYTDLMNTNLDDPAAILGWCRRYGLLGILSHRTLQAYLPPFWAVIPKLGPAVAQTSYQ